MSGHKPIVTIDGPSGGGKSTVSRLLAAKLQFTYLDTGAMYRAVAYQCREQGIDPDDNARVTNLLSMLRITLLPPDPGEDDVRVLINDREVGTSLRTPEMGMLASRVSAMPLVRASLTGMQQEMGAAGYIVAEGRDTGTVVFPQAAWKFFLDASPEVRAHRRAAQLRSKGMEVDEQALLQQIVQRDKEDSERSIAPLMAAADAHIIDSTGLDVAEVVNLMLRIIQENPCSTH